MIPKHIFFIWIGPQLPAQAQYSIEAFRKANPDFTIDVRHIQDVVRSSDPDVIECSKLINDNQSKYSKIFSAPYLNGNQFIKEEIFNTAFSDAFRYYLINKYGGIYLDTDTYPVKPFDDQLLSYRYFQVKRTTTNNFDPYFVGAEANVDSKPGWMLAKQKPKNLPKAVNLIDKKHIAKIKAATLKYDKFQLSQADLVEGTNIYINHFPGKQTSSWHALSQDEENQKTRFSYLKSSDDSLAQKKNIIIITLVFNQNNQGQRLQAYALKEFIKTRFDADCYVADFRQNFTESSQFLEFGKKHMDFIYPTFSLGIGFNKPDVIILGGDQVLNTTYNNQLDKNIAGGWLQEFPNIFSYSSSDAGYALKGNTIREKNCLKILSRFKALSLRERFSIPSIQSKLNVKVQMHIDPIFLLTVKEWRAIEEPHLKLQNKKFIFEYIKGKQENSMSTDKNGVITYKDFFNNKNSFSLSPSQFVWAIDNCIKVRSSSFHAFCFSLMFRKSIDVENKEDLRIKNVIDLLNVKFDSTGQVANFDEIDQNIEVERQKALEYLKENI